MTELSKEQIIAHVTESVVRWTDECEDNRGSDVWSRFKDLDDAMYVFGMWLVEKKVVEPGTEDL